MSMENDKIVLGELAGLLWTWWRGDPLPTLPPLPTFMVAETESSRQLATLMSIPEEEVMATLQKGHHAYVAYLRDDPVAYGWSAINRAAFGEGRVKFRVPATDRYLYNFVTLPAWRGMGIYPRLLQAILSRESGNRFWINHQIANTASARGIARAGFHVVSKVYFNRNDQLVLVSPAEESERARAGAELLDLPLVE